MTSEAELRTTVQADPGNPAFAELAELLRTRGSYSEALEMCLSGLSKNPTCHLGRLVLARVFYDRRMYSFAVRELEALRIALPQSKTIAKLLEKLAPGSAALTQTAAPVAAEAVETVAETDFEFDELDLIGQEKDKG